MERHRNSSQKHVPVDITRRSLKYGKTKSQRTLRESKDSRVSSIKEDESVDAEQNTSCRESITDSFFESFFSGMVSERKSIKPGHLDVGFISATLIHTSTNDSFTESNSSVSEAGASDDSKRDSTYSRDTRSHTLSYAPSAHSSETTSTSCPSCASTCMCFWRVTFKNGNVYEGQLHGSLMEGKGTFYWKDGSIYKGDFKDGYPCGHGQLALPDLSSYKGELCMGFYHGRGRLNIKSSPVFYNGEWKLSQRHGKGWILYDTNNWYEGDWVNSEKHGYGFRQYINGDKYKGNWHNDRISGEGCMMWHNNDYYTGEWSEGHQHGYGEYVWNLIPHHKFVFPNYNWYNGSWVEGTRSGAGIMNFGHESGAKLAGMWVHNKKDGPGVMVCGNGKVVEKNPLFSDDKPAIFIKEDSTDPSYSILEKNESVLKTYITISKQIFSKENLGSLNEDSITQINKSGTTIKMAQYIKLLETNAGNECPLKIPIHNVIHEVDLEYFVDELIQPGALAKDTMDISTMEIEHMVNARTGNSFVSASCFNYLPSNAEMGAFDSSDTISQHCQPDTDELKNLIINYLPQLRNIYKIYATLCADREPLSFEPVLIRLFLWQLYRDIGITDKGGVSIVEVDEMLMKNPNSCLETVHCPWEPIYFWQFLQSLVGVACLLYSTENHLDFTPSSGFMYHMFKDFLDRKLLVLAGIFQGNCFTHLRDLAPINAVYQLYKEIGEPHTVEKFLRSTCLKKDQTIPCYKMINHQDNFECQVQTGTNVVVLNGELSYLEKSSVKINLENDKRKGYEGLYTFSSLGKRKIVKSLCKISPQILLPSGRYQLQYRLSFIEFYEAVLLLTFEKVEQERVSAMQDTSRAHSLSEVKSSFREMSRMSTHSTRKRKSKK